MTLLQNKEINKKDIFLSIHNQGQDQRAKKLSAMFNEII